ADDAIFRDGAVLVLQLDLGAEEHAIRLVLARRHDRQRVETLAQELDAAVDLAQSLLAVDVLGVLRAVAVRGGLGDLARHARSLLAPQPLELGAQLLEAFGRDVASRHAATMQARAQRVNAAHRARRRRPPAPEGRGVSPAQRTWRAPPARLQRQAGPVESCALPHPVVLQELRLLEDVLRALAEEPGRDDAAEESVVRELERVR